MQKILIFSLILSLLPWATHARVVHSESTTYKTYARPIQSSSFDFDKRIEICEKDPGKSEKCEIFPTPETISPSLFKGTKSDWDFFFDTCEGADNGNILADTSLILSTLIILPEMGWLRTMAAEIGIQFIGGTPYPELNVNQVKLLSARYLTRRILEKKPDKSVVQDKYLFALRDIYRTCSQISYKELYGAHRQSQCIRGCHAIKKDSTKPKTLSDRELREGIQQINHQAKDQQFIFSAQ